MKRARICGRAAERDRLGALLDRARAGRSGVLVVRGESGIGRSTMLRWARERAHDMTVLEARAAEGESHLPFAGLADVLLPELGRLDSLPPAQAAALRGALALGPPAPADRFAVYAATLGALAAAAERGPLLVLVDDAQWLGAASAEALAFAGRRLDAEGVALIVAVRDGEAPRAFDGFEPLRLGGLGPEETAELLAASPEVAARLAAETRGNPLALLELRDALSTAQLAGKEPLPDELPLETGPAAYAARIAALEAPVQTALLVAAAEPTCALGPVAAAAAALGVAPEALEQAEATGLVALEGGRVVFAQPAARAAAYSAAPPALRRRAHRALAEAGAPEQRALHLAAAAVGPDEDAALALEELGDAAGARSDYAAAAGAYVRAAGLSPRGTPRTRRLLRAGEAADRAGQADEARRLLAEAAEDAVDPELAQVQRARGRLELFAGQAAAAHDLLAAEAGRLAEIDPEGAATALAEAALAGMLAGDVANAVALAMQAQETEQPTGSTADLVTKLILGTALFHAGVVVDGFRLLSEGAEIAERDAEQPPDPEYVVFTALALVWVGEHRRSRAVLRELVAELRARGSLGLLPYALYAQSYLDFRTGRFVAARAAAAEAVQLARDTGGTLWRYFGLGCLALVEAVEGDEAECRAHAAEAAALAQLVQIEYPRDFVDALGMLELGLGRPEQAVAHLERANRVGMADEGALPVFARPSAPDLIETYVRLGRPVPAAMHDALAAQTEDDEFAANAAVAWRCRGLVADAEGYDECFLEALRLHALAESPFAEARTALCYGERLRRSGRRTDARSRLRAALDGFEACGAAPWAEHAAAELRATGETLRRHDPAAVEQLTPQELQIASVVATGVTNRDAAGLLFLSPKTIEMHLSRIYRKLAIRSRAELVRLAAHEVQLQQTFVRLP